MIYKRYQYYGLESGKPTICWTDWYPYHGTDYPTIQPANRLKIEYKEI